MLFDPRVQVKAVECDAFLADRNDDQPRANIAVKHAAPDSAIAWGIAIADQPRLQRDRHGASTIM
jgi:hypothetical protein